MTNDTIYMDQETLDILEKYGGEIETWDEVNSFDLVKLAENQSRLAMTLVVNGLEAKARACLLNLLEIGKVLESRGIDCD